MRLIALAALVLVPAIAPAQSDSGYTFFNSAGVNIRYIDRGAGEPVVLLHGYTGLATRHWGPVIRDLMRDHRVIAIDIRGHGGSDKPRDPGAYGSEMGRDVIRLLDYLHIPRAHVAGYSLGAAIAGYIVATAPARFATATFVAGAPLHKWTREDSVSAETMAAELEGPLPFKSLIVGIAPPGQPPSDSTIRAMSQSMAARNDVRALAALNRGNKALIVSDAQIAKIGIPVFGITGSDDAWGVDALKNLKTLLPALDLTIIDGVSHAGIVTRPELPAKLRAFIDSHRISP
ncbi:MAG TPA: alpha/beta fold hydrolase [Gemmatimonadaceae bacterium]|nr:alpha/beta fold hydrolase [Gemmatimonadaceae bacterium]